MLIDVTKDEQLLMGPLCEKNINTNMVVGLMLKIMFCGGN
jgi:hypothetical protein